ncbi:MAG TPA: sensor histidine kinase [Ktedonobacteraceae bacterium]|nr:sensor histidine kinase [Ktedonobacteraceae bacterium]
MDNEKKDTAMLDVLDSPITRLVQDAERRRLARDLHDSAVQSLTALVADLEYFRVRSLAASGEADQHVAEKVEVWQELARDSLNSMRQVLGGLRVHAELDLGLEHALEILLASMQSAGYQVEFECEDWPAVLPYEYMSNIYAIARETLTNIEKHAHASTIHLSMFAYDGHLYISIADDGRGMKKSVLENSKGSGYQQGMLGMRERAALLGGRISFDSARGKGTRVDIDIPLPENMLDGIADNFGEHGEHIEYDCAG